MNDASTFTLRYDDGEEAECLSVTPTPWWTLDYEGSYSPVFLVVADFEGKGKFDPRLFCFSDGYATFHLHPKSELLVGPPPADYVAERSSRLEGV
jgi:hypothetical protein